MIRLLCDYFKKIKCHFRSVRQFVCDDKEREDEN